MTTEVQTKQENAVAEYKVDLEADAQEFEQQHTADEISLPFFRIVQALSPQKKRSDPRYNPDAKEGMFVNSASGQLYDGVEGVHLVRVFSKHSFIEWVSINDGGGFVAEYDVAEGASIKTERDDQTGKDIIRQGSRLGTPGNQLVETYTYYCFLLDVTAQTFTPVLVTMASTAYKNAKKWNYAVQERKVNSKGKLLRPPQFWGVFKFTTMLESNDKNEWFNYTITQAFELLSLGTFGEAVYAEAKRVFKGFTEGKENLDVGAAYKAEENATAAMGDAAEPSEAEMQKAAGSTVDDEIPY